MEPNPYAPPGPSVTGPPVTTDDHSREGARRRFRWQTIPTTLSWFAAALLAMAGLVWVREIGNAIVHRDAFEGFWLIGPSMAIVLLASAALNLWAGRRWAMRGYASALTLNVGSGLLLWGLATVLESHITGG
jgi:hypothetical protein